MATDESLRHVLDLYPRILFACHARLVRDPKTKQQLSAHQASILDHLEAARPKRVKDLAAHMGVTLGTMSVAVDRLVEAGFVVRGRDPLDKRARPLRLTEAGVRMREARSVLDPERVERVLGRLSRRSRLEVVRGLALLADAAREEMKAGAGAPRNGES